MRRISSRLPDVGRYLAPFVLLPLIVVFVLGFEASDPRWWLMLGGLLIGGVAGFVHDRQLKHVDLLDDSLVISTRFGRKTITVPFSQVVEVRVVMMQRVVLRFREPTEFGEKIAFVPTFRWLTPVSFHPDVVQLSTTVALAQPMATHRPTGHGRSADSPSP